MWVWRAVRCPTPQYSPPLHRIITWFWSLDDELKNAYVQKSNLKIRKSPDLKINHTKNKKPVFFFMRKKKTLCGHFYYPINVIVIRREIKNPKKLYILSIINVFIFFFYHRFGTPDFVIGHRKKDKFVSKMLVEQRDALILHLWHPEQICN